jgi:hypothetical protein
MDNFRELEPAVAVIRKQANFNKLWDDCNGDIKQFLDSDSVHAPKPVTTIYTIQPFSDSKIVVALCLDTYTPHLMIYSWKDAAHAIAVYRTHNTTVVFDPNCGELSCLNSQIETMWDAYDKDLKAAFKSSPLTYSIAAVGVSPTKALKPALPTY